MQLKRAATVGKRLYVETMLGVMGRALAASSQADGPIRDELEPLPDGFQFSMCVMDGGPSLVCEHRRGEGMRYIGKTSGRKPDVTVAFKHLHHAFLVLSFQEGTATAFARNRMLVDGDIRHATRLTRVLNRLESLILPKLVAALAVKEYPGELGLTEKLKTGANIYLRVAAHLVRGK